MIRVGQFTSMNMAAGRLESGRHGELNIFEVGNVLEVGGFETRWVKGLNDSGFPVSFHCTFAVLRLH